MAEPGTSRAWSLSTWILAGFVAGVATGLFLGELAAPRDVVAIAYIRLLQMAVLPYILVSLVAALGRLDRANAASIARAGSGALMVVWGVTLVLVAIMPLAFPAAQGGTFFSTSLLEPHAPFDFVGQYIPDNPFRALSDNVVPAVVLFAITLGVALMAVPGRAALIDQLEILGSALMRVNDFVIRLTPIGLFAIAANTAGTLSITEFERVQVYLGSFVALALLLAFGILPAVVAAVTPLSYRAVVRAARDPLLTALATGSLFVVLPQITQRTKELMRQAGARAEDSDLVVDVVVPVSFNFPHAGKVLTLGFIAFAAWAVGSPLGIDQTATLLFAGLFSMFASANVSLPYLLDLFELPADMFQLFLAVGVVNFRMATLVATMHTLAFALLATATVSGRLQLRWGALVRVAVVGTLASGVLLVGLHAGFTQMLADSTPRTALVTERTLVGTPVETILHRSAPPTPSTPATLDEIHARGVLRVGYDAGTMPFGYFNGADELVGFDIDMAHALAQDLGLTLELIPMDRTHLAEELDAGRYDVAMSAIALSTERGGSVRLTRPYLDLTMAFVVRDRRRRDFDSRARVTALDDLRIGVPASAYYTAKIERYLPNAELVSVGSLAEFFEGQADDLDALVFAAEVASAWTLLYPNFTVVTPQPDRLRVPVGYAVGRHHPRLAEVLDTWVVLKQSDQTIDRLYRHWVLGHDEHPTAPRWSVIRDVLGWIE